MPVVMPERLHRVIVASYEHAGVKAEDTRVIANQQVASHLAGHDSDGVHLLPTYLASTWCSLPLRRRG